MKIINYLVKIQNRVIEPADLKISFKYKWFNLAIVRLKNKNLQLIHFESGGKIPMFMALENKTIKTYYAKSLEALELLLNRIGIDEFKQTLTDTITINN